jgi:hypothetical protein
MDLWRKALNKEMSKVKVAWNIKDGVTLDDVRSGKVKDMIGFQEIGCHIVFDIKMDFTRKARFVTGSHTTEAPAAMTYSNKCCFKGECKAWFYGCCIEWFGHYGSQLGECILECKVSREDLVPRWT